LLNDHILRRLWPSWLTGKIGDFAWLIFAPFLLATLLSLLPRRMSQDEDTVGRVSIIGVGAIFALAKTWPAFHALTIDLLEALTGWPNLLRRDPTDLLALPALLIAWRIWQHSRLQTIAFPQRGWVLLPLAALATMANSPGPDYGIADLDQKGTSLVAGDFRSEDGGLTWQGDGYGAWHYDERQQWQIPDPANASVLYRFTRGESIERSSDGGQTWQTEINLSGEEARLAYLRTSGRRIYGSSDGPLDAVFHQLSGNLVVAMGQEGVLVRTPGGEWRWVAVGAYAFAELNRADRVVSLLSGEILFALLLLMLAPAAIVRGANRVKRRGLFILWTSLAWLGWLGALLVFPPAISRGYLRSMPAIAALAVALFAVPTGLESIIATVRRYRPAVASLVIASVVSVLVFLLPFVLWTQGGIPRYSSALLYALALVAAALLAGNRYVRRFITGAPTSGGGDHRGAVAQSAGG
jgi:hypothetical protein